MLPQNNSAVILCGFGKNGNWSRWWFSCGFLFSFVPIPSWISKTISKGLRYQLCKVVLEWAAALSDLLAGCCSWTPNLRTTSEDCDFAAWGFSHEAGKGLAVIWNTGTFRVLIKVLPATLTTSRETGSFYYRIVLVNTLWSKQARPALPSVLCSLISKRLAMPWWAVQLMTESAACLELLNGWSQYIYITICAWKHLSNNRIWENRWQEAWSSIKA